MSYRNRKLLDYAKHSPICFCCLNPNDGTVVAAHCPFTQSKSAGKKGHDWYIAYACFECHKKMDESMLSRSEREELFFRGFLGTLGWLFQEGKLKFG